MNYCPRISIVLPESKGEKMFPELVRRIIVSLTSITSDYEIILVNDNSPDNTRQAIQQECRLNPKVKGLHLSRNLWAAQCHYRRSSGRNHHLAHRCGGYLYLGNLFKKANECPIFIVNDKRNLD